ncbi:MAG: protein translocase subunit SecD [Nitratiruptor sp.]|nr:protein translocase subunit SecD [Nitratiruptor sp.]NPA83774.1 protein translocase subunit SecD [Campylobacterota bacterium]
MGRWLNYRFVIFLLVFIAGVALSLPSLLGFKEGPKITLGLDLQGGLHMLLGVDTKKAIESKVKSIASAIKYFAEDNDILIDELRVEGTQISFKLLDPDDAPKIEEFLAKHKGLVVERERESYRITLTPQEIQSVKEYAIQQAVDTIRNRLDQYGLAEPTVAKQGKEKILVELPGIKSPEEEQRVRQLIAKAAHLQLMAVDEDRQARVNRMSPEEAAQYGDVILEDRQGRKYLLKEIPILDGSMITDARVAFDQNNQPVINFTLNSEGARIFGDFTAKNVGKRLAVVLDDVVYSAPVIRERIGGGSGQISGGFTVEEAHDVAIALRSGALLAPVYMEEKRSVGPSLGADSIRSSFIALVSGFILVVLFMAIYYGIAGIIADIALVANLFLIIGIMALFGATLTLPGMAGIVLTVGMAVDANVIINERIRELLRQGVSVRKAIEQGYKNAMSAILDANITTLIAAIVLYAYGTGPIKGFALTISIGILASMLTAIVGTHGIYEALLPSIERDRNFAKWFGIKV